MVSYKDLNSNLSIFLQTCYTVNNRRLLLYGDIRKDWSIHGTCPFTEKEETLEERILSIFHHISSGRIYEQPRTSETESQEKLAWIRGFFDSDCCPGRHDDGLWGFVF